MGCRGESRCRLCCLKTLPPVCEELAGFSEAFEGCRARSSSAVLLASIRGCCAESRCRQNPKSPCSPWPPCPAPSCFAPGFVSAALPRTSLLASSSAREVVRTSPDPATLVSVHAIALHKVPAKEALLAIPFARFFTMLDWKCQHHMGWRAMPKCSVVFVHALHAFDTNAVLEVCMREPHLLVRGYCC